MQLLNLGRAGPVVTALKASVKITNNSEDNIYLLLFGEPSAIDDAGGNWNTVFSVTGAAYCPGPQSNPPSYRLCMGAPRVDGHSFPLNKLYRNRPRQLDHRELGFPRRGQQGCQIFPRARDGLPRGEVAGR
jgi:hypothetical protein